MVELAPVCQEHDIGAPEMSVELRRHGSPTILVAVAML